MFHKIKTVSPLPDFRLLVSFAEGPSKTYEVSPLFQRVPALAALRDTPRPVPAGPCRSRRIRHLLE